MDYRDYMDGQTYRLLEQTRQQMITGMIPKVNQPAFEIAKLATPQLSAMDHVNKQTADLLGTATKASAQLQGMMGARLTAQAAFQDLFPRPDLPAQLRASLAFGFKTPTIADFLAKNNATSIFSFNEPTIAEQPGTRVDTKALMGLTGLAGTAGKIAEQWRLANTGALSNFGESFKSQSAALDFEQALKSSRVAQAVLGEAWKLDEEEARRWAEADLTEPADTRVEERLTADPDLAEVVGVIQRYFVVYLGYAPDEAHTLVRRLVWVVLFVGILYAHSQVGDQLNDTVEFGLGMVVPAAISKTARKTADVLIPDGIPDTTT